MAKPQKILCFVQRQRKKRFLLPKDTRKLVVIDEEEPEASCLPVFLPAQACEVSAASCGPREFFAVLFFQLKLLFHAFFGTSTARSRGKLEHHDVI